MIAIIDYNSGNVGSVKNAVERLGFECIVTANAKMILEAEKVIFPGQGRAGSSMEQMKATGLDKVIKSIKKPFLGICLGMQLLSDFSEEDSTKGLSVIEGSVERLDVDLKVPHIGWNKVSLRKIDPLMKGVQDGSFFYFAHSYYFKAKLQNEVAVTNYGRCFASVVHKDNFYGVQFHPEKSGSSGEQLLNNFLNL